MPYWYQLLHQQCGCHIVWCTGKHKLSVGKYRLLHLIVFFRSASINLQVHMYRCSSSGVPRCVLSLGSVPVNKVITRTHHDQLCWAEVCLLSNHIMSINGTSLVLYSQLCTHTMSRQSQVAAELCFLVRREENDKLHVKHVQPVRPYVHKAFGSKTQWSSCHEHVFEIEICYWSCWFGCIPWGLLVGSATLKYSSYAQHVTIWENVYNLRVIIMQAKITARVQQTILLSSWGFWCPKGQDMNVESCIEYWTASACV